MRKALMKNKGAIAILVSDIHLSHHAPRYRRAEPDWYEAMARHLRRLKKWQSDFQVPVLCAGDVFHRWNSPPKLINFAIENLPKHFISIPGQHDLPNHRLEAVKDSAYWTVKQTNEKLHFVHWFDAHHFPWGTNATDVKLPGRRPHPDIALLHRYVCDKKNAYPGAPEESFVDSVQEEFREFDLVVSGDHHRHFIHPSSANGPKVINVGQFLCRNRGESKHPNVFLLDSDLNTTALRDHKVEALDVFNDEDEDDSSNQEAKKSLELEGMLAAIDSLSMVSRDLQGVIDMIAKTNNRSRVSIDLIRSILSERE